MRLACWRSSLASSRSASRDSSTFQAMTFHHMFQGDGGLLAVADAIEGALGQIGVLEILQVLEDGLADIEGLGAAGAPRQLFKPLLNSLWKSNGQHMYPAIRV